MYNFHLDLPIELILLNGCFPKQALLLFIYEVFRGVKGFVTDEAGHPLQGVQLEVLNRDRQFETTRRGEFWRILLNGSYTLRAHAEGYETQLVPFKVHGDEATVLNITMHQIPVSSWSTTSDPSTTTNSIGDGDLLPTSSTSGATIEDAPPNINSIHLTTESIKVTDPSSWKSTLAAHYVDPATERVASSTSCGDGITCTCFALTCCMLFLCNWMHATL